MELYTTNNQVLIPATQYIKEIKDMQSPNFSWAKDNTLWERVDIMKADIGAADSVTGMIKICHLCLMLLCQNNKSALKKAVLYWHSLKKQFSLS